MAKISGNKEWAVAAMGKQRDRNIRPSETPRENPRHRTTERNLPPPSPRENPKKSICTSVLDNNAELMERIVALLFFDVTPDTWAKIKMNFHQHNTKEQQ